MQQSICVHCPGSTSDLEYFEKLQSLKKYKIEMSLKCLEKHISSPIATFGKGRLGYLKLLIFWKKNSIVSSKICKVEVQKNGYYFFEIQN